MIRIEVPLNNGRGYPVLVGPGAANELAQVVPDAAQRVAIITQEGIGVNVDPGREHRVFLVPDGEQAKTLSNVENLCRSLAQWGLTRQDCIVGVGGGVVTDLAGFAAASYHRGTPVIHVATTLLGQIDAAIGGKTGVNLLEGKNLVGAFWQPTAVLCDTATLATLPAAEMRSGLGEMAKYHFLGGQDLAGLSFDEKVARCGEIKAQVVAEDERESGRRAILNYGHTLGHALETTGQYGLRHGEAVAIGLIFAAHLAASLGRINQQRVAEHYQTVASYDLHVDLPEGTDHQELLAVMRRDKKALNGLTFALDGPQGVEVVADIKPQDVLQTLNQMEEKRGTSHE